MNPIGRPLRRREDARLLTGQGRYLDDMVFPGALFAKFVRSPHAHARILGIDAAAAREAEGVELIATGDDLARWTRPLRMAPPIEGLLLVTVETMPTRKVRFDGDLVACIVARSRVAAEDAAELVGVEYEELTPVVSAGAALADGAALVDDDLGTNLVSHQSFAAGDPGRRFAEAYRVVEARFGQHRQTQAPMEPRGCCAVWDEGRQHLTMHTGNQAPHPYRTALAARLGLEESQVTVICPDIGGAFGQKIALYREELAVAALARALKRPVRWREERGENLTAAAHAREQEVTTRAAVDADGRMTALELRIVEDFGAYCFYPANYVARVVAMILTGPYRINDYAFDVKVALTNKCGAGPMRAPMAITSWVMDGTIDAVARTLGLDPIEVRRRNMLSHADLPFTMPTGEVLHDVTPRETLEAALAAFDVAAFRARQAEDRERGVYRGLGICSVVESTTYGSAFYKAAGIAGSGHEAAWVKVAPSGSVDAAVGLMGSGQGYETALAQAVASGLGVVADAVRMRMGNTDIAPYGMGSRGARGGTAGGSALFLAGQTLQRKICAIAAGLLGLNSGDDLRLLDGRVERCLGGEWQEAGLGLADIARIAYLDPLRLPAGMEPGLEAHRAYDPPAMTYSNAAHLCEVVVDTETGTARPVRYLVAEDCGTVLNPMIVEGQQHGAVALGLGGALREQVVIDDDGHNLTGSFMDYAMSTAADLPPIEIIACHTPSLRTPTGSKGMAEGGVMGAIGAVTLAVNDALAPFGVWVERQPMSPVAIYTLLKDAPNAPR
jgi:aerobic carbon-monoxide dehydrogenase large subunit